MNSIAQPLATDSDAPYPAHVAIIMDGNGRWAQVRGVSRVRGHNQGAEALRTLLESCRERPWLRYLTLYAFSTENWQRSPVEVADLMNLLRHYVKREAKTLHEQGIRMSFIGDRESLPEDIQRDLAEVEALTRGNSRLSVCMALSYGARQEIVAAMRAIARKLALGVVEPDHIDEAMIADHLHTRGTPDPDLLIRTGGDERLSNFLLWQSAYTELYFTDVLWPDFLPAHLDEAVLAYQKRERRFGKRKGA
ncbi:MAG: polyprenyl diphosphate synthase [Alphaproteobacteria bacterium]